MSFSALSTFFPFKIYPALFFVTAISLVILDPHGRRSRWILWMWAYTAYVLIIALMFNASYASSYAQPLGAEQINNLIKLVAGGLFFTASVNFVSSRSREVFVRHLDVVLHISFFFTAAQLFVYQVHAGFPSLIASSSSSASDLYDQRFCFWGMADKNVFGARIALFGFLYLLNFFIRRRRFPIWRTLIVLLCAFLSGSRTPMAALFIGICYVLYRTSRIKGRLALGTFVAVISPFALLRLIRIDTIFEPSDGMGVRIIYWSTFIQHFRTLSAFGSGFMSAHKFLDAYSPLYLGEPHLHNIFLNNYLDFGLPGFVTYLGFLISFYLFCKRDSPVWFRWYWTSAFLPLVALMLTLSTEYDSDTFVYLSFIYIIGHCTRDAQFVRKVKFSAIPPIRIVGGDQRFT